MSSGCRCSETPLAGFGDVLFSRHATKMFPLDLAPFTCHERKHHTPEPAVLPVLRPEQAPRSSRHRSVDRRRARSGIGRSSPTRVHAERPSHKRRRLFPDLRDGTGRRWRSLADIFASFSCHGPGLTRHSPAPAGARWMPRIKSGHLDGNLPRAASRRSARRATARAVRSVGPKAWLSAAAERARRQLPSVDLALCPSRPDLALDDDCV